MVDMPEMSILREELLFPSASPLAVPSRLLSLKTRGQVVILNQKQPTCPLIIVTLKACWIGLSGGLRRRIKNTYSFGLGANYY